MLVGLKLSPMVYHLALIQRSKIHDIWPKGDSCF